MKSWMLIHLLLLSLLLIHQAQGIRLITKGTPSDGQKSFNGRSNDDVEEVSLCKGFHCSGNWARKLMMTPISSSTTTVENQNNKNKENYGTKEGKFLVDSSSTTEQRQPETYPGILDIAGMDYSQARRKPPIHN